MMTMDLYELWSSTGILIGFSPWLILGPLLIIGIIGVARDFEKQQREGANNKLYELCLEAIALKDAEVSDDHVPGLKKSLSQLVELKPYISKQYGDHFNFAWTTLSNVNARAILVKKHKEHNLNPSITMDDLDFRRVHSHVVDQLGKYNAVVSQLMTVRGTIIGLLAPGVGGLLSGALLRDISVGFSLLCLLIIVEAIMLWKYSKITSPAYIIQYPYRAALGSIFLLDSPINLEPIQDLDGPMWKNLIEKYERLSNDSKLPNIDIENLLAVEIVRDLRRETVLRSSNKPK